MKVAILVGAGATLAEALSRRHARDRLPPLDTTFFELCRRARFGVRAPVRGYMTLRYGLDPFQGSFRMEEVFNYIYSDAFSGSPPAGCLDAYWALLQMYRAALARTTNILAGTSR